MLLNCDIFPLVFPAGGFAIINDSKLSTVNASIRLHANYIYWYCQILGEGAQDAVRHNARWQKCLNQRHCIGTDTPPLCTHSFSFPVLRSLQAQ